MRVFLSLSLSLSLSLPLFLKYFYKFYRLSMHLFIFSLTSLLNVRLLLALVVVPHHERYPSPIQRTKRRENAPRDLLVPIIEHGQQHSPTPNRTSPERS